MVDWFYIGYCTVMAMFAVAFAYAAAFGFRALRRLPRSLLLGFAAAATVATLTAQKTNNVPPNMNQPQMQQGGGSFQTGFTRLTGFAGEGNLVNLVNPVQTTIDEIARGRRVESVATNAAVSYAMPTNATLVGNWHVHGAASSFGNNVVDFGVVRTSERDARPYQLGVPDWNEQRGVFVVLVFRRWSHPPDAEGRDA